MWAQQLERSIEDLKTQLAREKAGRQHVEKLLMEGERVMTERENELSRRAAIEQAGLQRTLQDAREQKESLEERISVLNRRLDAGEGRERVLKSRVELLQGRLTTVFGGETPMPWEEIEVIIRNCFPPLTFVTTRTVECCRPTGHQSEIWQGPKQHRHRGGVGGGENKLEAACYEAR
jgi:chaperonin cofactor prefoldin